MLYVITGCSGGGKTTLVNALEVRGYSVSDEPGRKIVREQLGSGGSALPWINPVAFCEQCMELSIHQHAAATQIGSIVFFDRSLVDAVSAMASLEPHRTENLLRQLEKIRYAKKVFMAPPWPELFENDSERQHDFKDAVTEYDRLVVSYTQSDYSIISLPKIPLSERIDFVLEQIQ